MNDNKTNRTRTIVLWILVLGAGLVGIYLGVLVFNNSLAKTMIAIAEGELNTSLSGPALAAVQSLRSVILYVAIAWTVLMLVGLVRRQTPQEAVAKGWFLTLIVGVMIKLLGEFILNPGLFAAIVAGGLQKGFIYALIALGYTMVYGVVKLINFAHGDFFMVGAFVSFYTTSRFNMHHWPGALYTSLTGTEQAPGWTLALGVLLIILTSTTISAFLAVVVERVAYKPLRNAPRIAALITAVGVSFFLEYFSALDFSFGPDFVTYERPFDLIRWDTTNPNTTLLIVFLATLLLSGIVQLAFWGIQKAGKNGRGAAIAQNPYLKLLVRFGLLTGGAGSMYMTLTVLDVGVTNIQIIVMTASIFLLIALQYVVNQTKIGKAMRASAWDKATASLMGINVNLIISFTFALGAALAGAASVLYAVAYPQIVWNMGIMPGLRAFVAAVLGGIGNIPGAFVGSLIMGQAEELSAAYISTPMRDAIAFTILIIVLVIKPTGIFGEPEGEKA
ncbi:MAG: branched-chain amino acid ABC transporter permease [Anaerolineae bacterium]|nr:branched-chain amino acid ABC transporter permease [Anaerolineae bacterium]